MNALHTFKAKALGIYDDDDDDDQLGQDKQKMLILPDCSYKQRLIISILYIDLHEPKTNRNNLIMNSGDDFAFFPRTKTHCWSVGRAQSVKQQNKKQKFHYHKKRQRERKWKQRTHRHEFEKGEFNYCCFSVYFKGIHIVIIE